MTGKANGFGFFGVQPISLDDAERQTWRIFVRGVVDPHELEVWRIGSVWISLACPYAHPTEPRMVVVAAALSESWLVEEIRGPGERSTRECMAAVVTMERELRTKPMEKP